MIGRIIEASVRNRLFVLLVTALVVLAGIQALRDTPVDAIPDLSDVQVIVLTEYPGQAPGVVEDQVTYPLTSAMLAVPYAQVVRGYSFFGFSLVYVIFEDGTTWCAGASSPSPATPSLACSWPSTGPSSPPCCAGPAAPCCWRCSWWGSP